MKKFEKSSIIFDIETTGLSFKNDDLILLSYYDKELKTITDTEEMKKLFINSEEIIGHNIIRFDIPFLEHKLGINLSNKKIIDTLALSWYLYPYRKKHSLESYQDKFNISKIQIQSFSKNNIINIKKRCENDVLLTKKLYSHLIEYLSKIYNNTNKIINYLNFKMFSLREMEENKISIDKLKLKEILINLEYQFNEKKISLENIPEEIKNKIGKIIKTKPKNTYKKDGKLSKYGKEYLDFLKENNLPETTKEIRELNLTSIKQLKDYLFLIGWKPDVYEVSKATGKEVPKVTVKGTLTQSVKDLTDKFPNLIHLEGLFMIKHRIGVIKSILEKEIDNKIICSAHGLTNTLRLKHSKPIANLPKPSVYLGNKIRGSLIAPEGYKICGADLKSLEDSTKQHYIFFYDKKYVMDMRTEDFDPHLDIAVLTNIITQKELVEYKKLLKKEKLNTEEKQFADRIKILRNKAKQINFEATYGAMPKKLSETLKVDIKKATKFFNIYWKRNNAIKKVAATAKTKEVNNQLWIYNPVSHFWYFLKNRKDIFSTLNQSTGVYVFDNFLKISKEVLNVKMSFQYHDEYFFYFKDIEIKDKEIIEKLNNKIKLNVKIEADFKIGSNYSLIH